jgi:hypothetical protein
LQARVGDFDSRPVFVGKIENGWQTNFKLPPGLEPGWHDVRIRALGSTWSDAFRIAIDVPVQADRLEIRGARDGKTWKLSEIEHMNEPILSLWVSGIPENASRREIRIGVGDYKLVADYIAPWEQGKALQLNIRLPDVIASGAHAVTRDRRSSFGASRNSLPVNAFCCVRRFRDEGN